jgi:hypothetical protein
VIVDCIAKPLLAPEVSLCRAQVRRKSCGAIVARPQLFAFAFTIAQITLGVKPSPEILPALLMDRSNGPEFIPALKLQLSTDSFHPCRNGNGPDMAAFSSQVRDNPAAFPKLEILEP